MPLLNPPAQTLRLAAVTTAVSCARAFAQLMCRRWRLSESMADDVTLVVSELVTNAVLATGNPNPKPTYPELATVPTLLLRLSHPFGALCIELWDPSPVVPQRRVSSDEDESSRGLTIVGALCDQWGSYHSSAGGKVVWALATRRDAH